MATYTALESAGRYYLSTAFGNKTFYFGGATNGYDILSDAKGYYVKLKSINTNTTIKLDLNFTDGTNKTDTLIIKNDKAYFSSDKTKAFGTYKADNFDYSNTKVAMKVSTYEGNDVIKTGALNDYINAGANNDTVDAGAGINKVLLGTGNDTLQVRTFAEGFNTKVYLGSGANTIAISDLVTSSTKQQKLSVYDFSSNEKILAGGTNVTKMILESAVDKGSYYQATINKVTMNFYGADKLFEAAQAKFTITGTNKADVIYNEATTKVINALGGNDTLHFRTHDKPVDIDVNVGSGANKIVFSDALTGTKGNHIDLFGITGNEKFFSGNTDITKEVKEKAVFNVDHFDIKINGFDVDIHADKGWLMAA